MRRIEEVYGVLEPGMLFADLHIHGEEDDGRLGIERMVRTAIDRGLSAIGPTLHDNYRFGDRVYEYVESNNLPLTVYPGSEVTALDEDENGELQDVHLLVYGTDGDIEPYQSVPATFEQALKKGGEIVLAHPGSSVGGSGNLERYIPYGFPIHVEVFNAMVDHKHRLKRLLRMNSVDSNKTTLALYEQHKAVLGGAVGGTDAHKFKLGLGMVGYKEDLWKELREQRTVVVRRKEIELWFPRDLKIHDKKVAKLDEWREMQYNRGELYLRERSEEPLPEAA